MTDTMATPEPTVQIADPADGVSGTTTPLDTSAVVGLPEMLLKAHREIRSVLDCLRQSRGVIEHATVEKLHHTSAKLLEVSSTTEEAATGILDGLDRALAVVDELDGMDGATAAPAVDARNRLRDELYQVQACVQFQDITNQQLAHAGSLLADMEARLVGLARTLDPAHADVPVLVAVPGTAGKDAAFDPNARIDGAQVRQALADSIFAA